MAPRPDSARPARRASGVPACPVPVRRPVPRRDTGSAAGQGQRRSGRQSRPCGGSRPGSGGRCGQVRPPISGGVRHWPAAGPRCCRWCSPRGCRSAHRPAGGGLIGASSPRQPRPSAGPWPATSRPDGRAVPDPGHHRRAPPPRSNGPRTFGRCGADRAGCLAGHPPADRGAGRSGQAPCPSPRDRTSRSGSPPFRRGACQG